VSQYSHYSQVNRRSERCLDTCPKNDVISFSRKGFCATGLDLGLGFDLGLGLELRLGLELSEISLNTINKSVTAAQLHTFKYVFGQLSIRVSVLDA